MISAIIDTVVEPLRAVFKDRRGLKSLEYAAFAAGLLVLVVASIAGILGNVVIAYSDIGAFITTHAAVL